MDLRTTAVGDIAATLPGATALFRRHKIDFCCGGAQSLATACAERGLDVDGVVIALEAMEPTRDAAAAWDARPIGDLTEHIRTSFHEKHRRDLPELVRLAARVEAVHRDHPECPKGLADALRDMEIELEAHMQKEEQILFPMIEAGFGGRAVGPIAVMRHEHDEHAVRIRNVEALARGCAPPQGACNTWRAAYAGVRALLDDLTEHIHLENNVLFPMAAGR